MCCKKKAIENYIFENNKWKKIVTNEIGKDTPILKSFDLKGWNKIEKVDDVPNNKGVYCFVANKDFQTTIKKIFKPFLMIDCNKEIHLICRPQLNYNHSFKDDGNITFLENNIIYVGEANDLKSRYYQHISDKIDKTCSMKLGLTQTFYNNVDYYYKTIGDDEKRKELENRIRTDYGCWFGK